jgi:hypothetical protein
VIIRSADSRIGWKLRAKAYTPLRDLRQEQGCGRNIRGQAGQLAAKIRTLISFLNHHCFVEDENEVLMQRSFLHNDRNWLLVKGSVKQRPTLENASSLRPRYGKAHLQS